MTVRVLANLWDGHDLPSYSGRRYDVRYAERLRDAMPDGFALTVLADDAYHDALIDAGVPTLKMRGIGCGGWSHVFEAFHPDAPRSDTGRTILVGLDTIITGSLDWLATWDESPVGLPLDPYCAPVPCDAVVTFNAEGARMVWERYVRERDADRMARYRLHGCPSEMHLLRGMYAEHGWKPLEPEPERLLSYKVHVARDGCPWDEASMVYFHGHPKPADLPEDHPLRERWAPTTATR